MANIVQEKLKKKKKYLSVCLSLYTRTAHRNISFCICKCIPLQRISTTFPSSQALVLNSSYPTAHSVQPVSFPVSFHTPSPSPPSGLSRCLQLLGLLQFEMKNSQADRLADVTSIWYMHAVQDRNYDIAMLF